MFPAIKQSLVVVTVEIIQNPVFTHGRLLSMKQISEVEEKPLRRLYISVQKPVLEFLNNLWGLGTEQE
jgi:hypothetical protein